MPFPFTDQSSSKKRSVVVVSTTAYNAERSDIIVMAVTSQVPAENRFDIPIQEWQQAKLLKPDAGVRHTAQFALLIGTLWAVKGSVPNWASLPNWASPNWASPSVPNWASPIGPIEAEW